MRRVGIIVGVVAPSRASLASDQSTEPPITPCTTSDLIGIGGVGVESCSYEQIEDMLKEVPVIKILSNLMFQILTPFLSHLRHRPLLIIINANHAMCTIYRLCHHRLPLLPFIFHPTFM
jgi:hypothetical protein